MQPTKKAVVLLTVHIKQHIVFFRRTNPGLLIWLSRAVSKDRNVFGMLLRKDLQAGISGCLLKVSGGREGQSRLGLGLKVPVCASRRGLFPVFPANFPQGWACVRNRTGPAG